MNKQKIINIVAFGGGTGLSTLLSSLKVIKSIPIHLSSIVTVSDDGSHSGVIRKEFNVPAIGDIRKVISSLSDNSHEMSNFLDFRFTEKNTSLTNVSLGNLILLASIIQNGNFYQGVYKLCKLFRINGDVLPLSHQNLVLKAYFEDDHWEYGESNIANYPKKIVRLTYDKKKPKINELAIKAINKADIIIFGMGSLYTSTISNLIYPNVQEALQKSLAKKIYICNLSQEKYETVGMGIMDHIMAIENHANIKLNAIIANSQESDANITKRYIDALQKPLIYSSQNIKDARIFAFPLLTSNSNFIRHDIKKLQQALEIIILKSINK